MFLKTAWSSHQAFLHKRRRKKEKLVHPYSLMNGRIGCKTWRAHQKSPKNLGLEQRSEMGSQTSWSSVGSPLLGPELKSEGWLPPKLALKSGRNSWCCFISGPGGPSYQGKEAHSLWAGKNTRNCFWQTIWIKLMSFHSSICCWLPLWSHPFHVTCFNTYT